MAQVLTKLKRPEDPRLLVGISTADDAGVFLVDGDLALVQTVDLLTPMVEDPYVFGRIAAANSLSDVYAMGGVPMTALNIVGFPAPLDKDLLAAILQGGQDTAAAAETVVAGGHTFNEKEIKFGLAVTGRIRPERIVTNAGAKPGDAVVLTKPLGTGVFGQAVLTLDAVDESLYQAATESMMMLNRAAAEALAGCSPSAATDITGYGLLGHAQEMAEASACRIRFELERVPLLPGVRELSAGGVVDAGVAMNLAAFGQRVAWTGQAAEADRNILWESESSGGLLVSLSTRYADEYVTRCHSAGVNAVIVGAVVEGSPGTLEVRC